MTKLKELREAVHYSFLNIRNTEYIVYTDDFELTYKDAPKEYRDSIDVAIKQGNNNYLKKLIKERLLELTPFNKMTLRQLRVIAKHNSVLNYGILSKVNLIKEIENVVKRLKKNSKQMLH